jgi:dTDP-4-amino-4,6-dideoxygalactose transaminase
MMNWKVPLFDMQITEDEIRAVESVLRSRWLTMGEVSQAFEREFSEFLGGGAAIAVNNCTAALHMACIALGIGPGDEVVCPTMTFVATANAIRYTGATPVFSDIGSLDCLNITAETIEACITSRTKAIMLVHFAGHPCDMKAICNLAKSKGLYVIEDCAHAPGASIDGRCLGLWGDIGCFSFFSNKNMTTGEGGMVVTENPDLASKLRLLRSHGMTTVTLDRHKGHAFDYDVVELGYNYRTTEMNSAIGREQLKKLAGWNMERSKLVQAYRSRLSESPKVMAPFSKTIGIPAYHIMPVLLPEGVNRQQVMELLKKDGIQTSIHYRPIHTFSIYSQGHSSRLVNSEIAGNSELTLPLYPSMTLDNIDYVVSRLSVHLP